MQEEKHRRVYANVAQMARERALVPGDAGSIPRHSRQPFPSYGRRHHPRRENRGPRHRSDWRDGAEYGKLADLFIAPIN